MALFGASLLLLTGSALGDDSPEALHLIDAIELKIQENTQPSGLCWCQNHLLMISDRHDNTVFEIDIDPARRGQISPFLTLPDVGMPDESGFSTRFVSKVLSPLGKKYDWEGLTCVDNQQLLLASESFNAVLAYDFERQSAQWLTPSLTNVARQHNFFGHTNAGVEGLAAIDENRIILAFERQPRGFALLQHNGNQYEAVRWQFADTNTSPNAYTGDITDIWAENGSIYTLERFQHTICRRHAETWQEERCWHFTDTEYHPFYRYDDLYPGHAEGMTVHQQQLYVVTDNNYVQRAAIKNNRNPLLFVFKLPENWQNESATDSDDSVALSDAHDDGHASSLVP